MPQQQRSRRDHILPQGYLDGFTGTNGLLQVFNIKEQSWFPAKTANVAAIRGFYDYSEDANPDQTADQAFQEFEDKFPNLRRELIASNFANWRSHLDFLIRYINMFRVRSELFRQHVLQGLEETPPMVVDQVLENETAPDRSRQSDAESLSKTDGANRRTTEDRLHQSQHLQNACRHGGGSQILFRFRLVLAVHNRPQ
jgi:hypothetical protein